jgi:cysteine-rich CPCC protein
MTRRYSCLCCGFFTLTEQPPGTFAICPVCHWEDDEVQTRDPEFAGGANEVSLRQAQANFRNFGAAESRLCGVVRAALPHELPDAPVDE